MIDVQIIITLVAFGVSLITFVTPVLKLNTSIVKLNTILEHVLKNDEIRDERIKKHGEEIDKIKQKQIENEGRLKLHEQRLKELEGGSE